MRYILCQKRKFKKVCLKKKIFFFINLLFCFFLLTWAVNFTRLSISSWSITSLVSCHSFFVLFPPILCFFHCLRCYNLPLDNAATNEILITILGFECFFRILYNQIRFDSTLKILYKSFTCQWIVIIKEQKKKSWSALCLNYLKQGFVFFLFFFYININLTVRYSHCT